MDTENLINWFLKEARSLDWRIEKTPYKVLVSEMMLQQTQVKTVIPYFKRWMQQYPSLSSLAKATEEEVLKLWQGLGYYSRAKNLLKTAIILNTEKKDIPSEYEDLIKLPGIGDYTANAILAFAYNKEACVMDGNIERLIARFYAIKENIKISKTQNQIKSLILKNLPKEKSALYNEALMELGATICTPSNPNCPLCPLQASCQSLHKSLTNDIPFILKKKPLKPRYRIIKLIQEDNKILMKQVKDQGLYSGLWEVCYEEFSNKKDFEQTQKKMEKPLARFYHHYTQYKIECLVYKIPANSSKTIEGSQWVTFKELVEKYPITALSQKALHYL